MDTVDGIVMGEGVAFIEGVADIFIVAQLVSLLLVALLLCSAGHAYLCGTVQRRRCFRCPLMRREVEVEFLERWFLGVRRAAVPTHCSAFERPAAIACARRCVDRAFRTQWAFPLSGTGRPSAVNVASTTP
jgi:hypothetical protein